MKLSDAIRKGSTMGPQAFGSFADKDGGSCALMSALWGVGIKVKYGAMTAVEQAFPELQTPNMNCPAVRDCNRGPADLRVIVIHLNDTHRWSREKIAGWIDEFVIADTVIPNKIVEVEEALV